MLGIISCAVFTADHTAVYRQCTRSINTAAGTFRFTMLYGTTAHCERTAVFYLHRTAVCRTGNLAICKSKIFKTELAAVFNGENPVGMCTKPCLIGIKDGSFGISILAFYRNFFCDGDFAVVTVCGCLDRSVDKKHISIGSAGNSRFKLCPCPRTAAYFSSAQEGRFIVHNYFRAGIKAIFYRPCSQFIYGTGNSRHFYGKRRCTGIFMYH